MNQRTNTLQDGFATLAGGKLYYQIKGRGHPLVLIHAGFLDQRMWDVQFDYFGKGFAVLRYDVRGFGKSSRPVEKYSDIEDLYTLLTNLTTQSREGVWLVFRMGVE